MELLRSIMMVTTAAAMVCGIFSGCADKNSPEHSVNEPLPTDSLNAMSAEFDIGEQDTSKSEIGSFVITLYPEYAPESCDNFAELVRDGFYDGLIFHRVKPGFIAQTGDPTGTGKGGSDKTIKGEFAANGFEQNTLSHARGIVSMARRSNDMDSASSQFFICLSDTPSVSGLDGNYAAFGEVTEGMEVVDKFLTVDIVDNGYGEVSSPTEPITIEKAELIEDDDKGHPQARFTMTIG